MREQVRNLYAGFLICIMVLYFVGCQADLNLEDASRNARTINRASDSAMLVALLTIEKKKGKVEAVKIAKKVKEELEKNVIPLLTDPNVRVTKISEMFIMAKLEFLDKNYRNLLSNSFAVLDDYYKSPTLDDALKEEGVSYLRSFFNGAKSGCQVYLSEN